MRPRLPLKGSLGFEGAPFSTMVIGLIVSFLLGADAYNDYQHRRKNVLDQVSQAFSTAIDERMSVFTQAHFSGVAFYLSSHYVSREEWETFVGTSELMQLHPGMFGLGFTKRILASEIPGVEKEYATELGFAVHPVSTAVDLIPVIYIAPSERNHKAFGFDMGSESRRRQALEESAETGRPKLTKKIVLVQDAAESPGFLLYVPIFAEDVSGREFKGWIYSAFVASDFFETLLERKVPTLAADFDLAVVDTEGDSLFMTDGYRVERREATLEVPVHGETWRVYLAPRDSFEALLGGHANYVLCIGAFLVTLFFVAFQLLLMRTRGRAERLAEKLTRTHRARYQQLLKKNEELDSFTYIASHDLKSPLRGIDNLASWLEEDAGRLLDEESLRILTDMRSKVGEMEALMARLLEYSRVVRADYQRETIELHIFLQTLLRGWGQSCDSIRVTGMFPRVQCCPRHLSLVLSCLIESLSSEERGAGVELQSCSDSGPVKLLLTRTNLGPTAEPIPLEVFRLGSPPAGQFTDSEMLGTILAEKAAARIGASLRFGCGENGHPCGVLILLPAWVRA